MYIAIQVLAWLVASTNPTHTATALPDACDQLRADGGLAYCRPHGEGAPIWDSSLCCDDEACHPRTPDGCATNEIEFGCDYGERLGEDLVQCYDLVPNYCDVFKCPSPAEIPGYEAPDETQADLICCSFGVCLPFNGELAGDECLDGHVFDCNSLYSNEDGTVGCADDE